MVIELGGRGPHPDAHPDKLGRREPVVDEHETDQRGVVVLRSSRQKDRLVGYSEQRQQDDASVRSARR